MTQKNLLPLLAGIILTFGGAAQAQTPKAHLPLTLYADGGGKVPFIPSGYMGNTGAIKMNDQCAVSPHSGKTCIQADYTAPDKWGGVVLTGAKTLSFWARGAKGTEVVAFVYGLVGKDKPNGDTSTGKMEVHLTKAWKKYTLSLAGKDMSHIITGFAWALGATGAPETFYLDDIKYA